MQKLKHTKKPFWRNKKDTHDRALGMLMVVVGVLSLSFSLPAFGGNDLSNIAGVSALEVCTREFDACGADGSCAPITMEDGKLIPRACSAGECRSTPELQDKYREVSANCRQANALRNDAEMAASNWEEVMDNLSLGYGVYDDTDLAVTVVQNANAQNMATMKDAWDKGKQVYQSSANLAKALRAGATSVYQAVEWGSVATAAGLTLTTKFTEYQLSRANEAASEMFAANVEEANANWQACLNEARAIKATEQQLLGF